MFLAFLAQIFWSLCGKLLVNAMMKMTLTTLMFLGV